jgi:3D (Asp-Asp-Asp) domain-containing protein
VALHISGKLVAIGLVVAALITAFSSPRTEPPVPVALEVAPFADVVEPQADQPGVADLSNAVLGPTANPRFVLRATGYNSHESQTDASPFVTSTGARTAFGVVAVSRDLLGGELPYGSLVRIRDLGNYHTGRGVGAFQQFLGDHLFVVEDTMHARKTQQIDVWFESYSQAVNWGVRKVEVELIRYGRNGYEFIPSTAPTFQATPVLIASR